MAKKTTFFCKECGYETSGWMGKCPGCGMFNTFVEAPSEKAPAKAKTDSPAFTANQYSWTDSAVTVRLSEAGKENYKRHSTGIPSLDVLLESPAQIGMRASRLKIKRDILVCGETRFEAIAEQLKTHKPCLAIIDSIQTLYSEQVAGTPGGVAQIREVAAGLIRIAKTNNITIIMVGHIAKDGSIAGPKTIEHMVDTVLGFEGDATGGYRIIRSAKNRFGRSNEICFFEMGETGLIPVDSSKALLVAGRPLNSPGSVLTSTLEGNDALTIEVQALCTESVYPNPQRMTSGPERGRVLMLLAVCEKLLKLGLTTKDCFVNVIGGLKVSDPATDLAVCMAAVSSARGVSARPNTLILGEVGLSGEIRPVSRILKRCLASARLGITTVVLPGSSKDALEKELANASADIFSGNPVPEFIYADNLKEAADILFS